MEMLPTLVMLGYFMDTQTVGVYVCRSGGWFFFKDKVNPLPLKGPLKNEILKIGPM